MSTPPLTIRMATPHDTTTLRELYAHLSGDNAPSAAQFDALLAAIARIPHYYVYLAFWGEEAVGGFTLLFAPTLNYPGAYKYAVLDAITVKPSHRHRGIARVMLKFALQLATDMGCGRVALPPNLKRGLLARSDNHKMYP